MTEKDFEIAEKLEMYKEHWTHSTGLKKLPSGLLMMFYCNETDAITSSVLLPNPQS